MSKPITFKEIDQYLTSLGFRREETEGTHRLYVHDRSDGMLMLPGHPLETAVPRGNLVAIRRTLLNLGLISPDESELLTRAG